LNENLYTLNDNYDLSKRESGFFYEAIDSPLDKLFAKNKNSGLNSEESKNNEFNISEGVETNDWKEGEKFEDKLYSNDNNIEKNENIQISENGIKNNKLNINNINLLNNNGDIDLSLTKEYKARKILLLEKLKEEYHNLIEDKKNLENKIAEYKLKEKAFEEAIEKNEGLNLQNEIFNEKIKFLSEENKNFLERNNKITFENYELTNTNNQLKESLKYLEKERLLNKNKINSNFNRVKLYEKENNASKKKLNNLNSNIKNLTDKLNGIIQEKGVLEKVMEDMKQEYENKITNLLLEQQKIIKDSFLTTLNSLEEKKIPLEFFYEEEKNQLTIMLEDIVISEFTNLKISKIDKNQQFNSRGNVYRKSENDQNDKAEKDFIDEKNRLDKSDLVKSPSNRSSIMNINNRNIFNNNQQVSGSNHKNNKLDLENLLSLNKILSGSSKKSFTNTNTKRILMSNFSSTKKISAFQEENNNNICSAFYNSNINSDFLSNNQLNQNATKIQVLTGSEGKINNDMQNFSNFLTSNFANYNPGTNYTSSSSNNQYYSNLNNNLNSDANVFNEALNSENITQMSNSKNNNLNNNLMNSIKTLTNLNNLNDGFVQNSECSKVLNMTVNKNINNEINNSVYENDRYSGLHLSSKKKGRVSNVMSAKKNNNFVINENDENVNPNIQTDLYTCENSIIRKSNSKNIDYSILSNVNNIIIEQDENRFPSDEKNINTNRASKKLNDRNSNLSFAGRKALNNNNFDKCIKNININTEQINNFNRDDIKKIISSTSSTRHRKMISLDEALNLQEVCDKNTHNESNQNNYVDRSSYNPNNFTDRDSLSTNNLNNNSNYNNIDLPVQKNQRKKHQFNFESNHVDKLIKEGIFILNYESNNEINLDLNKEEISFDKNKVHKKIEFKSLEKLDEIKNKNDINLIDNVVSNFYIYPTNKEYDNILNNNNIKSEKSFLIDSNVNLITITSIKKSDNKLKMIISESHFDLIGYSKSKKFEQENLILSRNENIDFEKKTFKEIFENKNNLEVNELNTARKKDIMEFHIISEENFCLNNINKVSSNLESTEEKKSNRYFLYKNI